MNEMRTEPLNLVEFLELNQLNSTMMLNHYRRLVKFLVDTIHRHIRRHMT